MKKHILCFGDSNTHGYCADPADCADSALARFNEDERWTRLLQKQLGEDYLVIEEGLSGRTTSFDDPVYEHLSGMDYIYPCLKSHEPISLLIIMLGTNDTKERIGANAFAIGLGLRRLVQKAMTVDCWGPNGKPNILVIAPPVIPESLYDSPVANEMGVGCVAKSQEVPMRFRTVAEECGVHFVDANELGCTFNQIDFMHLTRAGHAQLADALAQLVPMLTKE